MTKFDKEIYENYTPSENVQKRLNKIDTDPDMMAHHEVLAILEFEEALDEESGLTKNKIMQIIKKIERDTARNIPTKRTLDNRLEELVEKEIVMVDKSPNSHEYWKKEDDKVDPYYWWYLEESIRKVDPYVRLIIYPHTISSLGVVIYIIITLPLLLESADGLLLLLLSCFYLSGHLFAYLGVLEAD